MSGYINTSVSELSGGLDQTIGRLLPAVADLLERISHSDLVAIEGDGAEVRLIVPLRFPNGIGRGEVVAQLFRWRGRVRLDIAVDHNRLFARPDGTSLGQRCFLNDYLASVTLDGGSDVLPAEFQRKVISGALAARDAVQRHNRRHRSPWSEISVTADATAGETFRYAGTTTQPSSDPSGGFHNDASQSDSRGT